MSCDKELWDAINGDKKAQAAIKERRRVAVMGPQEVETTIPVEWYPITLCRQISDMDEINKKRVTKVRQEQLNSIRQSRSFKNPLGVDEDKWKAMSRKERRQYIKRYK